MHWSERMKTKLVIGQKYLTRKGLLVEVVDSQTNNRETKYEVKDLTDRCFLGNYMVNEFGGFGNYPNHYDLIKVYSA